LHGAKWNSSTEITPSTREPA